MQQRAFRIITVTMMFLLTFGIYIPGQAAPQTALMPAEIINIAHFFKPPPNMSAATAVSNFGTIVLTNGDQAYRDQLIASGFSSTIPEYFRSESIYDPGSCTASPVNNQVAYKAGDFCNISQNHPDWFLLDANGSRITVTSGGDYYRMDPANAGWKDFFLSRVVESQSQYGWSALFLDNVEGSLSKFYGPRPVKYPDNASYQAAIAGFLQYLQVDYSQKYGRSIIGNIVARDSDAVWFNYLQYLDGAMQERFAVDWSETSYLSANQWANDLAFMEQTQAAGKYVILVSPGNQGDLNRQNFAFASYLLISNGKAAFRYSTDDAYRDVWLYDNYKVNLGSPLGARYLAGSFWKRDFSNGYVVVDPVNHTAFISVVPKDSDIRISIGAVPVGGYNISSSQTLVLNYLGMLNGPVKIASTKNNRLVASQRTIYQTSFSEIMGFPVDRLTTEYWFPWYDHVYMRSWIVIGNPTAQTAEVDVYIGKSSQAKEHFSILPGGRVTPEYENVLDGPVRVVSTNGVNIFSSERVTYQQSVSEIMGYPANQFTSEYWFPWYDHVYMRSWIVVANPTNSTAEVDVYIGSNPSPVGHYSIEPKGRVTPEYENVLDGPVRVVSTNGVNIFASQRVTYLQSVSEVMGYPSNQFTSEYFFPWYDRTGPMNTWIVIGNPTNSTAEVDVYIGNSGTPKEHFSIPGKGRVTPFYTGLASGPVRVVSTNGVNIFSSERVTYIGSISEVMGYAGNRLTTEYYFPWYDNVWMSTSILVGRP